MNRKVSNVSMYLKAREELEEEDLNGTGKVPDHVAPLIGAILRERETAIEMLEIIKKICDVGYNMFVQGLLKRMNPNLIITGGRSPVSPSRKSISVGSGRRASSKSKLDLTNIDVDGIKVTQMERILLNYLKGSGKILTGGVDETAILMVTEGGVITYTMDILTEKLIEVESKSTEITVSGLTEKEQYVRSIASLLTTILLLFKGFAKVQALKSYLASVELGLVPLLAIIINKLREATDDITNCTLYCLESLAKYISLAHSAEEGAYGHFEEHDSCNILLAILRVCHDHSHYDSDQQTRAFNVLRALASKNTENCTFMMEKTDITEDNRFFRSFLRRVTMSQGTPLSSADGFSLRPHSHRKSKYTPLKPSEEIKIGVIKRGGRVGSTEKFLAGIKAPVSDSVSAVSVITIFCSILQAFITQKLGRSQKSNMFYVFDVLSLMAGCEDVSVGEGIFLSPITNLLISIIDFAPSSEQGAKGMGVLSGLSENPWVRFRMLQMHEGLKIPDLCIKVIRLGIVAGRNAALQVLINMTVVNSTNGIAHPSKFQNARGVVQSAKEEARILTTIYSSSKSLVRQLLRNESDFLRTVLMAMRSGEKVGHLMAQGGVPTMGDGWSVNQITLERCCTIVAYFSSAILAGYHPEGYASQNKGVLDVLEAEVKGASLAEWVSFSDPGIDPNRTDAATAEPSVQAEGEGEGDKGKQDGKEKEKEEEEYANDSFDDDADDNCEEKRSVINNEKGERQESASPLEVQASSDMGLLNGLLPVFQSAYFLSTESKLISAVALEAMALVSLIASDPRSVERVAAWPGTPLILSIFHRRGSYHPKSAEGIALSHATTLLLALLTARQFPDNAYSPGTGDIGGVIRAMQLQGPVLFRAIRDGTEDGTLNTKLQLCAMMLAGSRPEGIEAQISKEFGLSGAHTPSATAGGTETAATTGIDSSRLEEHMIEAEERHKLLATLDDFLVDIATIVLQAPEAKQFPLDKGAEAVNWVRTERSGLDNQKLAPPRPSHAYPAHVTSMFTPTIGRTWLQENVIINGTIANSTATALDLQTESSITESIAESEGRGVPVVAVIATVREICKGDANQRYFYSSPQRMGLLVDLFSYLYEVGCNSFATSTADTPSSRSQNLLGLSAQDAERACWMLVEVFAALSGASFTFKRAPFSLLISWFPGATGEKKFRGMMTRLRGLWASIRSSRSSGIEQRLSVQLERKRRLCALLYKRLSDSLNDTNFVSPTIINADAANFVVSNTHISISHVCPVMYGDDRGKASDLPLHITFSYSRHAQAQPSVVEHFARKMALRLEAEVWLYDTGSTIAAAANDRALLDRQDEILQPEDMELYVKDERLLRQDAVRNAMNYSQVVIIALSEEYQQCPLLRAEAEHAVILSKKGACKVHFIFTQPYYCPRWDERSRTAIEKINAFPEKEKMSVSSEEEKSHEPRDTQCCNDAARQVKFNDARWGLEKPYFFSQVLEPHPPLEHRPLMGWAKSILPANRAWFSLWSETEIDWLADHFIAHLEKPIPKDYIITRDYFRGY